jgi:hypothetical protein
MHLHSVGTKVPIEIKRGVWKRLLLVIPTKMAIFEMRAYF